MPVWFVWYGKYSLSHAVKILSIPKFTDEAYSMLVATLTGPGN